MTATADARVELESWFVRNGMPHAIDGYSANEDVLTRAAPLLTVVFFAEVFIGTFSNRLSGWAQAAGLLGGLSLLLGLGVATNRWRGRPALRAPDDIGSIEIAVFLAAPAVVPFLFANERLARALVVIAVNLVLLAIVFGATSYGVVGLARMGWRQVSGQVSEVVALAARSLPLLLLFTAFMFLNAEMWQVAHELSGAYFVILVGAIGGLAVGFVVLKTSAETDALAQFDDWDEAIAEARRSDAPLVGIADPARPSSVAELRQDERVNVGLLLIAAQLVQLLLVGAVVGAFYIGFGMLAVREATIVQWTTAESVDGYARLPVLASDVVLTREHLVVAGLIAAFSILQVAVATVTDESYRRHFGDQVRLDARRILAVRAVYRALPSS